MTATRVILGKERLHATDMGNNLYRLENIPFFTQDYALGDIVRAVAESEDTYPIVQKLVTPSGNTTIQLEFGYLTTAQVKRLCKQLDKIGIGSEGYASPFMPTHPAKTYHVRTFNLTENDMAKFEQVMDIAEQLLDEQERQH